MLSSLFVDLAWDVMDPGAASIPSSWQLLARPLDWARAPGHHNSALKESVIQGWRTMRQQRRQQERLGLATTTTATWPPWGVSCLLICPAPSQSLLGTSCSCFSSCSPLSSSFSTHFPPASVAPQRTAVRLFVCQLLCLRHWVFHFIFKGKQHRASAAQQERQAEQVNTKVLRVPTSRYLTFCISRWWPEIAIAKVLSCSIDWLL